MNLSMGVKSKGPLVSIKVDLAERLCRCNGCAVWIKPGSTVYEKASSDEPGEVDTFCQKCGREEAEDP